MRPPSEDHIGDIIVLGADNKVLVPRASRTRMLLLVPPTVLVTTREPSGDIATSEYLSFSPRVPNCLPLRSYHTNQAFVAPSPVRYSSSPFVEAEKAPKPYIGSNATWSAIAIGIPLSIPRRGSNGCATRLSSRQ